MVLCGAVGGTQGKSFGGAMVVAEAATGSHLPVGAGVHVTSGGSSGAGVQEGTAAADLLVRSNGTPSWYNYYHFAAYFHLL